MNTKIFAAIGLLIAFSATAKAERLFCVSDSIEKGYHTIAECQSCLRYNLSYNSRNMQRGLHVDSMSAIDDGPRKKMWEHIPQAYETDERWITTSEGRGYIREERTGKLFSIYTGVIGNLMRDTRFFIQEEHLTNPAVRQFRIFVKVPSHLDKSFTRVNMICDKVPNN